MLVIVVVGVVLDALIVGLLGVFVLATLFHFSGPRGTGIRRCPSCRRDGLDELAPVLNDGLRAFRCSFCGAGFHEGYHGRLERMPC